MSKRRPKGPQSDTISRLGEIAQLSFNLEAQDAFVTSLGIDMVHMKALPSPIGLKERGDYRRSDALDTESSNGMVYEKVGTFTATMVSNSRSQKWSGGGALDPSTSRLILPRFYNSADNSEQVAGSRIYVAPGDRVYIADPNADDLVPNYHRMEYEADQDNRPMFPIKKIEKVEDSRGQVFREGKDFEVTCDGNIRWLPNGQNPGIDPDTKRGRVYTVRYLYKAFWYIIQIPNEVRITNTTDGDTRSPQRMAQHVVIQREYVYQNTINGGKTGGALPKPAETTSRTREEPTQSTQPAGTISVNMDMIGGDGDYEG